MPPLCAIAWLPLDTWIVVVGALGAMACALLGTFLVLRKMSMMGDAISHAVLPGLAIAFLVTGSRDSLVMLAGAGVVGVLTAVFTQWIHAAGKVDQGASMGVVFTILFAVGLILIRQTADHVDLDPECVLYGAIEFVPLDTTAFLGWQVPRAAITVGVVLVLNLLFVTLLYKELKLTSLDPALATTVGINAHLVHYLLMTLVAVTTVAVFESVGSILVIAMFIVPPAAAHLLTDRLSVMLLLSAGLAALSAALGHVAAITLPAWLGLGDISTNTAGMMAVMAGVFFVVAALAGPRHGIVSRAVHRIALSLRIVREDILGLLYRLDELGAPRISRRAFAQAELVGGPFMTRIALWSLRRAGQIVREDATYHLTPRGRSAAQELVRSHRLWESFLEQELRLPPDHVHCTAERLEHVTGARLQERLAESLGDPGHDPHGEPIPDRPSR